MRCMSTYGHAGFLATIPLARLGNAVSELDKLKALTRPLPGRPGWRVDAQGREWYSAAWL